MQLLRKPSLMALVAFNFFVGKCYIAVVFTALELVLPADGLFGMEIFDPTWVSVAIALAAGYAGVYFSQSQLKEKVDSALKSSVDKDADVAFMTALDKFTGTFLMAAFGHAFGASFNTWNSYLGESALTILLFTAVQAVVSLWLMDLLQQHEHTLWKAVPSEQRLCATAGGTKMSAETQQTLLQWHVHKNFTTLCCGTFSSNLAVTIANRLGKATLVPLVGDWIALIVYSVAVGTAVEKERRLVARARLKSATKKIMAKNILGKLKLAAAKGGAGAPAAATAVAPAAAAEQVNALADTGCEHHDSLTDMFNLRRELTEGWHDYAYASLFMIPAFGFVNAVSGSFQGRLLGGGGTFITALVVLGTKMAAVALLERMLYLYLASRHTSAKKKDDATGAWNSTCVCVY
jgi:hypothetical protein